MVEKFADYWNKDNVFIDKITYLPIVDGTVRLANLRSGGLDLIERVLATDIKTVRDNPKLKLIKRRRARLPGHHHQPRQRPQGRHAARQGCARAPAPSSSSIDRDAHQPGRVQRRVRAGQPVGQPDRTPTISETFPVPKRDVAKAKALLKEAGVTGPITLDFMVPNGPETRAVAEVVQAMAAEAGFDLKIRVTEFATSLKQAEDGEYELYLIGWSGRSDPDGNSYVFQTCRRAAEQRAATATRRSTPLHDAGARQERPGRAQEGLREGRRASS